MDNSENNQEFSLQNPGGWRTKNGFKVIGIRLTTRSGTEGLEAEVTALEHNRNETFTFNIDPVTGEYQHNHGYDLVNIEIPPEPESKRVWVNFWDNGNFFVYFSEDSAKTGRSSAATRVAVPCILTEITDDKPAQESAGRLKFGQKVKLKDGGKVGVIIVDDEDDEDCAPYTVWFKGDHYDSGNFSRADLEVID